MIPIVLILDGHSPSLHELAKTITGGLECQVLTANSLNGAADMLREAKPTIALIGPEFASVNGQPIEKLVKALSPETVVIVLASRSRPEDGAGASG